MSENLPYIAPTLTIINSFNECELKNIFAFLSILFGEDLYLSQKLLEMPPSYLIEKWQRYVMSDREEHPWGLHPNLRHDYFDSYFDKWKEEIKEIY